MMERTQYLDYSMYVKTEVIFSSEFDVGIDEIQTTVAHGRLQQKSTCNLFISTSSKWTLLR